MGTDGPEIKKVGVFLILGPMRLSHFLGPAAPYYILTQITNK